MFDRDVDYPTAVASYDDEGVRAAVAWCVRNMQDADTLTVWTALKSNLRNCQALQDLVARHGDVEHVTGRGGSYVRGPGPVLMAWADMEDSGKMMRGGGRHVRALCVITWNDEAIRPWVSAMRPQLLGDASAWTSATPDLDPVLVEALTGLTAIVNHNNTIAAGFEKDMVVGTLLALHDAGIPMEGPAVQAWALAHGWSSLGGKRPSSGSSVLGCCELRRGQSGGRSSKLGDDLVEPGGRRTSGSPCGPSPRRLGRLAIMRAPTFLARSSTLHASVGAWRVPSTC